MQDSVKLTGLDSNQIPRYTYDEKNQSIRVTVVAGEIPEIKVAPVEKKEERAVETRTEYITVPTVERIEVPVIIKETDVKVVEVPVLIVEKQVQVIEVEKPIIVTEYKTIEVPVIVKEKEIQIVHVDKINYKLLFIVQAITLALLVVSKLLN